MEKIFKAKRLDNGEWHVFGLFDIGVSVTSERFMSIDSNHGEVIWLEKYTICQYTGINDSEGNRIFEGDEMKTSKGENYYVKHVCSKTSGSMYIRSQNSSSFYDYILNGTLTGHNIHDRG